MKHDKYLWTNARKKKLQEPMTPTDEEAAAAVADDAKKMVVEKTASHSLAPEQTAVNTAFAQNNAIRLYKIEKKLNRLVAIMGAATNAGQDP